MEPDMFKTLRISHPALCGAKNAETVRFYTEILGMELVLRQPNLDYPSEEHLFFHVGNDNFIAYFVPVDEAAATYEQARNGSGGMDHLALDVDDAAFDEAQHRLAAAGIPFEGPADRGYERSIYFKDPNKKTRTTSPLSCSPGSPRPLPVCPRQPSSSARSPCARSAARRSSRT
jgi:glyoxalase family protein